LELEVGSGHKNVSVMGGFFWLVDASMVTPGECDLSNLQMTSFLLSVEGANILLGKIFPKNYSGPDRPLQTSQ